MDRKTIQRIEKEYKELTSKDSLYSIGRNSNDILKWSAMLQGPQGTPYAGGVFTIDIEFPKDYPFKPPKCTFRTKIYHPNIKIDSGSICVDILKNKWTPSLTIEKVLLSISVLLAEPNPDDPLEKEIGQQFKNNKFKFEQTAREWTNRHA